jgi:hypothetical protein
VALNVGASDVGAALVGAIGECSVGCSLDFVGSVVGIKVWVEGAFVDAAFIGVAEG